MAIPSQSCIEVPLLLELERAGGKVSKETPAFGAFLKALEGHFPALTSSDLRLLRKDGRTLIWQNSVEWARNKLRQKGQLQGGVRGTWEVTSAGRQRLWDDLERLGIPRREIEDFVLSGTSIPARVEARWQPKALTLRREKGPRPVVPVRPVGPEPPAPEPPPPVADDTRSLLLQRLLSLSPSAFEKLMGEVLRLMGMANIEVTARSADGGIDAKGIIPILNLRVGVQAKRWNLQTRVSADPVRSLLGAVFTNRQDRGIFITTSSFTPGAEEVAENSDGKIILIDGEKLIRMMLEKGLGVREVPVTRIELDERFFSQFSS